MRQTITKQLFLVLILVASSIARAEEDASATHLRQELQAVWYAGDPAAFLEALEQDGIETLFEDHEQACRLGMYLVDAASRGDYAAKHAETWKQIASRLRALAGKAPEGPEEVMKAAMDGDPMQTWARVEFQILDVIAREKLGAADDDDWKRLHSGAETISRTERAGIWTTYGYGRAFDLSVRSLGLDAANRFSAAMSFMYFKTKMGQRVHLFERHAMAVAGAYLPFGQGWLAATSDKPNYERARPKLEDALRTIADYAARDRVPASALQLHNDIVDLIDEQPDLEMEATRKTATPDRIAEALLPRHEGVETNVVLALPLSRRWRVLEGRLGDVPALHILRNRKAETAHYAITVATLSPKSKHILPGSKKGVKGSAHRAVASALLKVAKRRLGSGAKGTGPKKGAFHALTGGYRYDATAGEVAVQGFVGKGPVDTVVIEVTRRGPSDEELPADIQLFFEGLAYSK